MNKSNGDFYGNRNWMRSVDVTKGRRQSWKWNYVTRSKMMMMRSIKFMRNISISKLSISGLSSCLQNCLSNVPIHHKNEGERPHKFSIFKWSSNKQKKSLLRSTVKEKLIEFFLLFTDWCLSSCQMTRLAKNFLEQLLNRYDCAASAIIERVFDFCLICRFIALSIRLCFTFCTQYFNWL